MPVAFSAITKKTLRAGNASKKCCYNAHDGRGLGLPACCPPLMMQHLPLTVRDSARRMECWRMHEIRLRCPRREYLVPDRDGGRGRRRVRRDAPRRREVFSQGTGKGDRDLSAAI